MAVELRDLTTQLFAPAHQMLEQQAADAAQHGDVQLRHTVDLFLDMAGWTGTVTEARTHAAIAAHVDVEPHGDEETEIVAAVMEFMRTSNSAVSAHSFESYVLDVSALRASTAASRRPIARRAGTTCSSRSGRSQAAQTSCRSARSRPTRSRRTR